MFVKRLKNVVEGVPYPIGKVLATIPFSIRFGRTYSNYRKLIKELEQSDLLTEKYVIENFSKVFEYAKKNYPFYQDLYKKNHVLNLKISSLADIEKVPIITKAMIREHLIKFSGSLLLNTGGTSGEPFNFYVDKNAFAREWAHMHAIWKLKNYRYTDLKLTLRGKNLGNTNFIYNPVHNEFILNTYKSLRTFKNELIHLFKTREIKYLHGYPSTIFEFLKSIEQLCNSHEQHIIRRNLVACLLSSEFPHPNITAYFTRFWNLDYISWYGHSEMCVLAYDEGKANRYKPFISYGYPEVIEHNLIGTSWHNFDMPLIRYNTGDIVEGSWDTQGILKYFSVTEGRNADYITDCEGKRIALTALIFGRHHKAFNYVKFIQVQQLDTGKIIFYLIADPSEIPNTDELLDLSNVNINYEIKVIRSPYKTKAGKLKLKI